MTNQPPREHLELRLIAVPPELERVRKAARGTPIYLVGGTVRDLLLDRRLHTDVDVVVEGDAAEVARRLDGEIREHERFATAKARLGDLEVDLTTARTESYLHPGALPDVRPATLAEDLARRDFTINAMAVPLHQDMELIDPHSGRDDLEAGLIRVLHEGSFRDDPTRALRAARYAARFGFELEPGTAQLLAGADLDTVSRDRRDTELRRMAAEAEAVRAFQLAAAWGLVELRLEAERLLPAVERLVAAPPWSEVVEREAAILAAAVGPAGAEGELASATPSTSSDAVALARGHSGVELALGRALSGEWLDRYVSEWRSVVLEIGGEDLIAAGVPQGPAIGRGLAEALRRKLDGEVSGREAELEAALEAARGGGNGVG